MQTTVQRDLDKIQPLNFGIDSLLRLYTSLVSVKKHILIYIWKLMT